MQRGNGFSKGLITGIVVGGVAGMLVDPMKDRESNKMRHGVGAVFRGMGNIIDSLAEMRK
ncbi:MAG: hypothetical protein Q4C12_05060 [Clostridia bacterium]|nr:hypothetical protein [Clostridia bacterium]